MSGPVGSLPRNVMREVEAALHESSGWDYFEKNVLPLAVADTFRPADDVLVDLAHYANTAQGRRVLAWLHDLTDLAPYPIGMKTIEDAAMASARHQGRASVGHVLKKAVAEGTRLINQNNGAK